MIMLDGPSLSASTRRGSDGKCGLALLSHKNSEKNKKPISIDQRRKNAMDNVKAVSGESIRLRLTEEMKRWLFEKSAKENRPVSDIMRSLIAAEMNK